MTVTPSTFIEELYVYVTFTMARTHGTNVTYVIDFDDGTAIEEFYTGEGQNYTVLVEHAYTVQASKMR